MGTHRLSRKSIPEPRPGIVAVYTCPNTKARFGVTHDGDETPVIVGVLTPCCAAHGEHRRGRGVVCQCCGTDVPAAYGAICADYALHGPVSVALDALRCPCPGSCADEALHHIEGHVDNLLALTGCAL